MSEYLSISVKMYSDILSDEGTTAQNKFLDLSRANTLQIRRVRVMVLCQN